MMTPLRLTGPAYRSRAPMAALALVLACALALPARAAEPAPPAPQQAEGKGGRIREVTVTKSPYSTTIRAAVDGAIENYNSFKLDDPFRIVVDIWGVEQGTAASEIPVGTPQVKVVKVSSQDRKLRLLVETPADRPMPFIVNSEGGVLSLSVGGGPEEKVTSVERLQNGKTLVRNGTNGKDGKAPAGGAPAILGIDLEDFPGTSNVVLTTAGNPSYQVTKGAGVVTLTFPDASADKGLLRSMDARKFEIPVQVISPSRAKKGIAVTVGFTPGSAYTVEKKNGTIVVAFPKGAAPPGGELVARATVESTPQMTPPEREAPEGANAGEASAGSQQWGFLMGSGDTGRKYKGQRISMDFKDADLTNVFRIIAEVSNLNIITSDEVKGKVSVRLVNVPWDQALDIVLRSKNLGATMEGNVLRIAPVASLQKEEQDRLNAQKQIEQSRQEALNRAAEVRATQEAVFDTVPVNYSKASEMLVKIKPLASKFGKIDSDDRTNVLIIRDLPQNIEEIRALVARLDTSTPQVLIEARIVEVETTFARELGIQWGGSYRSGNSTQFGMTGAQDTTGAPNPGAPIVAATTNPFTATTPPGNWAVNLPAAVGAGSGGGIAFGILKDNLRLDLALTALESSGNAKIVSSPKVVTVDNKEATIEQGTQIPYSTVSASGTQTQFVDATLRLRVTPHITPDGRVSMKVDAQNDSPGETTPTGQLAINKKKATTEVLILDGETAVIGGIIQVARQESQSGLPWLSKIPVLGYLFRRDTNTARNRELLIFITPKIIKPEPIQAKAH
ncbi:MAG TPA: type IV pilus secretin PilQ [Candidatus Deferrimicrobiaceae bacterium]